ncbi:ELM1/GtrOC1 family putative glycosyltransferase [Methylopila sp. Yamaguchi]|uniref:ELM1/GtrOC1 family putative glycosyltransferase n=1 Tax=Methylopila sp. Yamaguchi TaxID=1437817 RepID=UPI000CC70B50|nr:ELM1/GtrOC1 family putative glycosyltransferase [Methylopila sp. Yamaguchi]GBD50553.1 nucleoside-diphosphate-sugar epimerase-like protein [Methylopila sp. Yamaguchi]
MTAPGRLWALLGRRAGDNRQIVALAEASGLAWEAKPLAFGDLTKRAATRNGSFRALDAPSRASLVPPWPDVVVAAGRWSAPIALAIRHASGGRTRLVHVGRPWRPLSWFDLVVTTPQYGLPAAPNVLINALPLTTPRAAARDPALEALPRPRLLVLVGGDSPPRVLDAAAARALGKAAIERAARDQGSLLVATSPRTSPDAVAALTSVLADATRPIRLSVFGEGTNHYAAFLTAADAIVVTDDSAAMTADAVLSGAPVTLHRLPRRPTAAHRRMALARALVDRVGVARAMFDRLIARGIVTSIRDLDRYAERLEAEGLMAGGDRARRRAAAELEEAATRVRALVRPANP